MTDEIYEKIVENLKKVHDPEISVDIYNLGLIYLIDITQMPIVTITHTLTSAFCPAGDEIVEGIRNAAMSVEGVTQCEIITTFIPEFGPDMMSEEAKLLMGFY